MAVVLSASRAQGTHKAPFYHVVATDSRKPRDGKYLEDVGVYDPDPDARERIELKAAAGRALAEGRREDRARRWRCS